jgi:mRNA-degrading endonuclease toxin of MazEF toxin-antitoxin module
MILRPGEVVLIRIGFHQTPGGKVRVAVVLLDSGDEDFVAAPVTSRPRISEFDVTVQQWRQAGLNTASTISSPQVDRPGQRRDLTPSW